MPLILETGAAAGATGAGQTSASQLLGEQALGNSDLPASLFSMNTELALLNQGETIEQILVADHQTGAGATLNVVGIDNNGVAYGDTVAAISASDSVGFENQEEHDSSGMGTEGGVATSLNSGPVVKARLAGKALAITNYWSPKSTISRVKLTKE